MTAINKIIDWANEPSQPLWLKSALRLLLEKNSLEKEDFLLLFRIARLEVGFNDDIKIEDYEGSISDAGYTYEEHPVVLKKIGPMNNIGLVSNGSFIELPEKGLTVIYGNNGAGKSSYVRVLKNTCLTRGEKPNIRGNIFKEELDLPHVEIEYKVGDKEAITVEWTPDNSEIPDLKAIRVFDSKSANHYIEKEGSLGYKPAGLHLLDQLSTVFQYIKNNSQEAKSRISTPWVIPKLSVDTPAGRFLELLSKDTTKEQLNSELITEDELFELEKLPSKIADLTKNSADKTRKEYEHKISRYTSFSRAFSVPLCLVTDHQADKIEILRKKLLTKLNILEHARNEAFAHHPIQGVGSSAWKALWDAANLYSVIPYPDRDFPVVDEAKCLLCIQDIGDEASKRLNQFSEFVNSVAQSEKDAAETLFNDSLSDIFTMNFIFDQHSSVINEIAESVEGFREEINYLFENILLRKRFITFNINQNRMDIFPDLDTSCLENLSSLILKLSCESVLIKEDVGLNQLIEEKNSRLKELNDKKVLTENAENIRKEIFRQKAIDAYSQIERQTNTAKLTRLGTQINTLYVASALEQSFQEELEFFQFNNFSISTKTRGELGNQKLKFEIANTHQVAVSEVASEGEAKCFALAGILAELRTDNRLSCIIFDDPVNSLDHKWTAKVASRMVKESLVRQVIIFTHDIVFLKLICEASELIDGHSFVIKSLDRTRAVSGIVRSTPPWDALTTSKRISYLNVLYRELRKIDQEGTEGEYNDKAGKFYGLLREAWERLIEEKLLNKVVERFSRGIPTQRLRKLIDIEQSDIERVDAAMTKCSALLDGHDTAPSMYQSMPKPDEIMRDIDDIKNYEQELTNSRKRN
jgi:energy-coupling factor transporter ATP-binding protein EcfA2